MLLTSKEANKLLQQLENEHETLLSKEDDTKSFLASVGEDVESCRPAYDYQSTQEMINEVESKIIKLKHCINKFISQSTIVWLNSLVFTGIFNSRQ